MGRPMGFVDISMGLRGSQGRFNSILGKLETFSGTFERRYKGFQEFFKGVAWDFRHVYGTFDAF